MRVLAVLCALAPLAQCVMDWRRLLRRPAKKFGASNSTLSLQFECTEPKLEVSWGNKIQRYRSDVVCGNLFMQNDLLAAGQPGVKLATANRDKTYMFMMLDPDCGMNGSWPLTTEPGWYAPCRHWTVGNVPGAALRRGSTDLSAEAGTTDLTTWYPSPKPKGGSHRYGLFVFEQRAGRLGFEDHDVCQDCFVDPMCCKQFNVGGFIDRYDLSVVVASNWIVVQHGTCADDPLSCQ
ncbi:hypothetical protein M885DRAFT_506399 [Pelagophyceae sp. CCMP2097]|nr:hypothetical protein M885DRAFT_506399 [Pelagophyceae sp. CCMP2097]